MRIAVRNLLDNAVRHGSDPAHAAAVEVEVGDGAVGVRDRGPGLPRRGPGPRAASPASAPRRRTGPASASRSPPASPSSTAASSAPPTARAAARWSAWTCLRRALRRRSGRRDPAGRHRFARRPRGDLGGAVQAQLRGEQPHVLLVLTDSVGEDLQRQQCLGRGGEDSQAGQIEDRRGGGILAFEEALDRIVQPAGWQPSRSATTRRLVDEVFRLEDGVDVTGRAPLSKARAIPAPPTTYISPLTPRRRARRPGRSGRRRSPCGPSPTPGAGSARARRRRAGGRQPALRDRGRPESRHLADEPEAGRNRSGSTDQPGDPGREPSRGARRGRRGRRRGAGLRSEQGARRSSSRERSSPRSANSSRNSRTAWRKSSPLSTRSANPGERRRQPSAGRRVGTEPLGAADDRSRHARIVRPLRLGARPSRAQPGAPP